jgi:N-acyl-D-aspartate/D-glutamate deacylase
MEPRFGYDFSDVRVHADARADTALAAIGARAFTVDADIVFRRGEFVPHTQAGRALLAHELAHVAQRPHGQPQLFRHR